MLHLNSTQNQKRGSTTDQMIRGALVEKLTLQYAGKDNLKIIPELGVNHGRVRIDVAVVNGVMYGYEIKSDRDTLYRLPDQVEEYSRVFDQVTIVVGKRHLFDAINAVRDWWGVMLAKTNSNNEIIFQTIREPKNNPEQEKINIARLLWREEALKILEEESKASGFRSKARGIIYEQLAEVLEIEPLKKRVRDTLLLSREGWRPDVQLVPSGD